MRNHVLFALSAISLASAALAQGDAQPAARPPAAEAKARHLVLFTRAGPNFARIGEYRAEAIAHQKLFQRLAAEGHHIAGGAFEGLPIFGMTVWRSGIDEATARAMIADDKLPALGIVDYEFRTLAVQMGAFR